MMSEVDARRQDLEFRREALRRAAEQVRALDFGEAPPAGGFTLPRAGTEQAAPSSPAGPTGGTTRAVPDSATDLGRRYRAGDVSPVEVTQRALERVEAAQPTLNAFITLLGASALEAARASE